MMKDQYFVMLHTQDGSFAPLVSHEYGDIAVFTCIEDAKQAAEGSILGYSFGYEVFQKGYGE